MLKNLHKEEPCRISKLHNPYSEVDWDKYGRYKANLHTHTTVSDGTATPGQMIRTYKNKGYSILAITDHDNRTGNKTTWPWADYGVDPLNFNMVAVQGNEITRPHHIGSYFSDYGGGVFSSKKAIEGIGQREGVAVFFHPGRHLLHRIGWYEKFFRKYDHLAGIEVLNRGNRFPFDRKTWDRLLTRLMPERPVWGFANDDSHDSRSQVGRDWNVFLLPELSEAALKDAMINGRFYFSTRHTISGAEGYPPAINSISIDENNGTITIDGYNYEDIRWISNGRVVQESRTLNYTEVRGSYVRAVLKGKGGETFTQPFGGY